MLNLTDLFAESMIGGRLVKQRLGPRLVRAMEKYVYRRAGAMRITSQRFQQELRAQCVSEKRIHYIPDWANGDFIKPQASQNWVRERLGLTDEFLLVYSGSLGHSSNLEAVLDAATVMQDSPDIQFLIVGEGVKRAKLENKARDLNLIDKNVRFWPLQPRAQLPDILAAADVCLVTLSLDSSMVATQGKLYSILAAGRPVIAVAPTITDLWDIIAEGRCGYCVSPGDTQSLTRTILTMQANRYQLERMGGNARALFEDKYALSTCIKRFDQILHEATGRCGET